MNYFVSDYALHLMRNSLLLALTTMLLSLLVGITISVLFLALDSERLRQLSLFLLFIFFAIEPIIYLGAFQQSTLFNAFSAFWQSVLIMSFSMSALSGTIFIFGLSFINREAITVASMVASPKAVLRFILKPQLLFMGLVVSTLVFVLVFGSSEVSSILGYRTYAEDFLAQISLMDEIDQAVVASIPFYLIAFGVATLLALVVWRYRIRFQRQISMVLPYFKTIHHQAGKLFFLFLSLVLMAILILLGAKVEWNSMALLIEENGEVLINSLLFALMVAVVTVIMAINIYRVLDSTRQLYQRYIIWILLFLTLLTPSSLIAFKMIAIMQFFNINILFMEYLFFIMSSSLKLLPLAVLLMVILYQSDVEDEGLKFLNILTKDIFFKITLPTYGKRWLFVGMIIAIFALNELSMTVLLMPVGFDMMIIKIYNLLHYGDYSTVTFLSLLQITVMLLILIGIEWVTQKRRES